jgi:16S rRNA (uracil1498-N3)-methyltransferase
LVQGIAKGDKMDMIVRDATELGVDRIVPILCERSVARPASVRAGRWRRIAVEAARQCGRGDTPEIAPLLALDEAVRDTALCEESVRCRLCMSPSGELRFGSRLMDCPRGRAVVAVGPEGGFASSEHTRFVEAGFAVVSLGPLVLRTETVCAAVLGAIRAWDQANP